MQVQPPLLILLAVIVAIVVVFYQYFYRTRKHGNLSFLLSLLRFISLFGLILLLINPKLSKTSFILEKPNLLLLTDNSSSVKESEKIIRSFLKSIKDNNKISEKFNLKEYSFGQGLVDSDNLTFSEKNTDINKAISTLNEIYDKTNSAIVIISDGNQTIGANYGYSRNGNELPIYPIIIGDTTRYEDLRVDQVNVNRYAFLKNKFPIEAYINYEGSGEVSSTITIELDGNIVFRENAIFTALSNTKIVSTLIESSSVGPKSIKVMVTSLSNEKNKTNNKKTVAIEVIDEKNSIVIVSDIIHPDIGALKKAIESNEQRTVSIKKPSVNTNEIEAATLFILYQPNSSFNAIQKYIAQKKANALIITGNRTNWQFVNGIDTEVRIKSGYPNQDVFGNLNRSFSRFDISEFSFNGYPPLESDAGAIVVSGDFEALINMQIKGVDMSSPLLFVKEEHDQKKAFLFGENLWKWRMQSYRENKNFKNFDDFIGKLIFYLTSTKPKNRLQIEYKPIYEGSNMAQITATYFDEGFEFDPSAIITLKLDSKDNSVRKEIPMLLKSGYYESDLSDLPAGDYKFTVNVQPENRSKTGEFSISEFDVEQQFPTSDYKKLVLLATNSGGSAFFPTEAESLIQNITDDPRFRPIQSSTEKVVSLIDFRLLLGIITAALSLEWFIRKYNGLT